jgi:hypothetical protein
LAHRRRGPLLVGIGNPFVQPGVPQTEAKIAMPPSNFAVEQTAARIRSLAAAHRGVRRTGGFSCHVSVSPQRQSHSRCPPC